MKKFINSFLKNDSGQSMTEYALIIALVAVVVIGGLQLLGTNVGDLFDYIAGLITTP